MIKRIIKKLRGEAIVEDYIKKGMTIGANFWYGSDCYFDPSHCFLISIGNNVTFSTHVHLVAHDASTIKHIGYAKIGCIEIGDDVFVGANTTILPGVSIGNKTIIGAGSVVTEDCDAESVYAGVPAKKIYKLSEYLDKVKKIDLCFDEKYTLRNNVNDDKKKEMKKLLEKNKMGLIK